MFPFLLAFTFGMAPIPPGNSAYLPPNLYLVRVTTAKVWKNPKEHFDRARLKVTAVVCGPARLRGREFEASTRDRDMEKVTGTMFVPHVRVFQPVLFLEQGTEGFWWIYED